MHDHSGAQYSILIKQTRPNIINKQMKNYPPPLHFFAVIVYLSAKVEVCISEQKRTVISLWGFKRDH